MNNPDGTSAELVNVLSESNGRARRTPHVLAVTSGKGGVGKTNISANLALQLRQLRRRVLLLDADLGLANVDVIYHLNPEHNISHVLSCEKKLSEILVKGPGGVQVLPASSGVMEATELTEPQRLMLLQELEQMERDFDFLIIDTAAGISSNVIYFALAAQTILVVLTSEPTSMADAYALIKVLSMGYRQNSFSVVVNEVGNEFEALEVFKRLTSVTDRFLNVSIDFLGYITRDSHVREAVQSQRPFVEMFPNTAATQDIKRLARRVLALENDPLRSDLGLLWRNLLTASAA